MGDVAMLVPIVLALQNQNESMKITVVSNSFFEPIFKQIDNVAFIGIDTKNTHKGFVGIFKIFKQIYSLKPTHFADLHNSLRSRIIRFLLFILGVKIAVLDKGRKEKKDLISNKNFKALKHTTERYADVLRKLKFNLSLEKPYFLNKLLPPEKYQTVLANYSNFIGVAPFAMHEAKTYPLDLMQDVIFGLAKKEGVFIFLFGGKNEREALLNLSQNKENIQVVACNFKEELALISNLNVMLSMDSGNGHLSAIYGVKTITLWSGTHPFAGFSPYFQPIENCITPNKKEFPSLPNSIFGNKMSEDVKRGFRSIEVERVVGKVIIKIEIL